MASLCFKKAISKKPIPRRTVLSVPSLPFHVLPSSPAVPEREGGDGGCAGHRTHGCAAGVGRRDDRVFSKCSSCIVPSPLSASLPCHYLCVSPAFFSPRCLSYARLWFPALPALPTAAETLSSGNGRSSGQRTPRDAAAGLEQFAALRAVVAFKSQFKCD